MNKGQMYYSDFYTVMVFPSLEILRKARFTDTSHGGYTDIKTPNGPPGLYMKLQTDRLSRELGSSVTWFEKNEPFMFVERTILNKDDFYHIIVRDKIGWFKMLNYFRFHPLVNDNVK